MSNVRKAKNPEVVLHLDRPRKFAMDWNAFSTIEEQTGKPYQDFILAIQSGRSTATQERLLLYAGLQTDAAKRDETLTLMQAGEFRSLIDSATFADAFAEALKNGVIEFARILGESEESSEAEAKNEK